MNCLLYLLLSPLLTFLIHCFFYLRLPVYNTYKSLKVTQFITKMKVWISLFIFNCFAGVKKKQQKVKISNWSPVRHVRITFVNENLFSYWQVRLESRVSSHDQNPNLTSRHTCRITERRLVTKCVTTYMT